MPQIIVTAGAAEAVEGPTVMLRERVNATDFESERFTTNLLERLGWAVEDATQAEQGKTITAHDTPARLQPDWDPEPVGVA